MELRAVETLEELRELRAEVLALERRLPGASPYVTHRWVTAHWAAFQAETCCRALCAFDAGRLVGWLPLAWARGLRRSVPPRVIRPVGNGWGILTVPCETARPDAAAVLVRGLKDPALPRWDMVLLGPLRATEEELSGLRQALAAERLVTEASTGRNPVVRLDATWKAFLDRQSRNFRQTVRRKLDGVELDGCLRVRHEVDPSWQRLQESVVAVSSESWQGSAGVAVGATERGRAFYRSLLEPDESFRVHLTTLDEAGTCIAYLVGLERAGVYHAFDTGFDPGRRERSPGLAIHLALLRALCERQLGELDLGFDAPYKARFAPELRTYQDLRIFSGEVPRALWRLKRVVRVRARSGLFAMG